MAKSRHNRNQNFNKKTQQLSRLLFADDQVIIADTGDKLQKAAHKLYRIITEYGLNISVQKTKSMAFKGGDPVRTKIVILTYLFTYSMVHSPS